MRYEYAPDMQRIAEEICLLMFPHVRIERVRCFRAYGSSARGTIARCHALGKLMQKALSEEDKIKTIIHELMHIPQAFGGGFRHHDFVTDRAVNKKYKEYQKLLKNNEEKKDKTEDWEEY
jgi:predicted metallopeptidase